MTLAMLGFPRSDPTPIFDAFRGNYSTELLTAAVTHFRLFERLKEGPHSFAALRAACGLGERGAHVLVTAMRAMNLLTRNANGELELSEQSREHLIPGTPFDVSGYIGLAADSVGVKEMIERLCTNTPAGAQDQTKGAAFIYREGIESAMESEASARHLTMMLAGRARNCAPALPHPPQVSCSELPLATAFMTLVHTTFVVLRGTSAMNTSLRPSFLPMFEANMTSFPSGDVVAKGVS